MMLPEASTSQATSAGIYFNCRIEVYTGLVDTSTNVTLVLHVSVCLALHGNNRSQHANANSFTTHYSKTIIIKMGKNHIKNKT